MSGLLKIIDGSSRSPLIWFVHCLLRLLSLPYRLVIYWRNVRFDKGYRVTRVSVPVISIGNLTTGGTGKTPMVKYVAQWLRDCGLRVTLLSRGYRAEADQPNDEALELERRLPDVPHLQNPNRVESAQVAIEEFAAQILLLDDGFQHRFLERDLDIVLIDATCPFGYGRLLPAGLLREPVTALNRADVAIITRTDRVSAEDLQQIRQQIGSVNNDLPIIEFGHAIDGLENYSGELVDCEHLQGERVLVFSGIGNHQAFKALLESRKYDIVCDIEFADHYHYDRTDIERICRRAQEHSASTVICTMKDLVKIQVDQLGEFPLWALAVSLEPTAEKADLDMALGKIVDLVGPDEL